jgi:hypothetical protein
LRRTFPRKRRHASALILAHDRCDDELGPNENKALTKRADLLVELRGFEPLTFCMPYRPGMYPEGLDVSRHGRYLH